MVGLIKKETHDLGISKKYPFENIPSQSDVLYWLISEKHLFPQISFSLFSKKWIVDNYLIDTKKAKRVKWNYPSKEFNSYSETLEEVIVKILEIL